MSIMASRNESRQEMQQQQVDFIPEKQKITGVLSGLIGITFLVLGSILLGLPSWFLRLVFGNLLADHVSRVDLILCRLTGGIILGQGLSSLLLLVNLYDDFIVQSKTTPRAVSVDKCRTATSLQALTGLLFVVVGLLDDRASDDYNDNDSSNSSSTSENVHSLWMLEIGFGILIAACFGLMFSYWPVLLLEEEGSSMDSQVVRSDRVMSEQNRDNSLTEPLLGNTDNVTGNREETGNEDLESFRALEEDETPSVVTPTIANRSIITDDSAEQNDEEEQQIVETSRIRGTRRLLNLAAPQVLYLYVGCAVLLIRLPFSLSIPHFVSTTLGAVGRGDFEGARREVLLLFLLGTIDAALDFWCVFLFGYGKKVHYPSIFVVCLLLVCLDDATK